MKNFRQLVLLALSIVLACFQNNIQSQLPAEVDSLFQQIKGTAGDSIAYDAIDSYIEVAYYRDLDLAMKVSLKEFEFAKKHQNQHAESNAYLNIGIVYDLKGLYDSALYYYEKAKDIALAYGFEKQLGDIYNNYSITYAVVGKIDESISTALKALSIFEKLNDSLRMAKIYNNLGSRYFEMEYYDEALDHYEKAARINALLNDSGKLAFNYGNIGLLYAKLKQNEKALTYFTRSLQLQDTVNDPFNHSIALHNLALAHQRLGNLNQALNFEKRAYVIADEVNDELGKISILNGMANISIDRGEHQKALEYFIRSSALAEQSGARYYLIDIYDSMSDVYAELHDYQNAFLYNLKSGQLKDSILTTEKDKAIQKIRAYEDEKKQQEITLLTKDSEIQKLNLKRQKIIRNSVVAVGSLVLLLSLLLLHRYRYVRRSKIELSEKNAIINKEKERSDNLLLNILPAQTAEELKNKGHSEARHFGMVTVMFTDFKGFTFMAEKLSPQELVNEIDFCFKNFDQIISKHNIEKIKTIGDSYMCAGGLPVQNDTNPEDVVKAALEIQEFMSELKMQRKSEGKPYFELRIGINTGPVVAGIVGIKKFQYDIWGDTVNIASRMESGGEVGRVNISQMTWEKVQDKFNCTYRGKIEAKNKGPIDMYFADGPA